jgi:2-polyprenyl-3-methyl-5-hydroxy-6-metoxy-1,4-benzoquinol methylase
MRAGTEKLITSKCCICNGVEATKPYMQVDEHNIVKCHKCSLVYLEKYPQDLFNFIEESKKETKKGIEFWSFPNLYKKHKQVFDTFFEQRVERIEKFQNYSKLDVLDIGIGYGFWNEYLAKRSYNTYGIDVSAEAIDYCNQRGLPCEFNSFESFEAKRKYSLVCMFDVLEHFADPLGMLVKARGLMDENALLYIQVPNVIGLKVPYGHSLGLPYHLWQFEPKTLTALLEKAGFEVQEYWTGIQGVIGHCEKGGPSFMRKALWGIANFLRRGNRIQIIVKIK